MQKNKNIKIFLKNVYIFEISVIISITVVKKITDIK